MHAIRTSAIRREALRVAPGKPNFGAGLRAAVATTIPLWLAGVLGRPELALAGLAGFTAVLCDKGGAYRMRALSMLGLGVGGSLATLAGMLCSSHLGLSLALVIVGVGFGAFLRVFGAEATSVGTMIAMSLVIALTHPTSHASAALTSAACFGLGTAWAALISLALWPLRPYRPARRAVADTLRALARVAESLIGAPSDMAAQVLRRERVGAARSAIETARAQLGSLRKGRVGPSHRGEQLLALVEGSDRVLGALIAIEDGLAFEPPEHLPQLLGWIDRTAHNLAGELLRVADALEAEVPLQPATPKRESLVRVLHESALAPEDHEPRILLRAVERVERLVQLARPIDDPTVTDDMARVETSELTPQVSKLSLLEDHLTLDSAMFRHALRCALATAVTLLIVNLLELDHGYWATLTCLVIMQPHGTQTWAKALQRVLGTALGAAAAFLLAGLVSDPMIIVLCVFAFVSVAVALLPLNYGAFTVFLTPAFVLLAETHTAEPALAGVRVLNTLLGAMVALLCSRLLFPLSERDQIRPLLGNALVALSELLLLVAQPEPSIVETRAARRRVGLALLNAEASYQRLLTEAGIAPDQAEAVLTLLLYAHRLSSGLITVVFARGTGMHQHLMARAGELRAGLSDLRAAIVQRRPPAPAPDPLSADEAAERVEGLFEQLAVMRAASLRLQV
jgi:uncharacterized membrane protein YccC